MRTSQAASGLLTRTEHRIRPDASRTLGRLFVPGQETLIRGGSRALAVIDRILDLNEQEVEYTLARTLARARRTGCRPSGQTTAGPFGLSLPVPALLP